MQVLPEYISYLSTLGKQGYIIIRDHILSVTIELLTDKSDEELIRNACNNIVKITEILSPEDRGTIILTTIISLANDDSEESARIESRCLAAKLFNATAQLMGRELCENYIVPQLAGLTDDQHFKVRKAVATNLTNIYAMVSNKIFSNKIMGLYKM